MSVSEADLRHVAALSRLTLPDDRVPGLLREMNRIIDYVGVLGRVELNAPAETSHESHAGIPSPDASQSSQSSQALHAPLRADVPGSVPLARPIAAFAPEERDGFFLVPRLATHE